MYCMRTLIQVKSLEGEISDLHGEFELDRLDYLETIRKQDQQLKLLQQILDRLQPTIRKDSNYCNLEKIKRDSVWNDDQGRWIVPEMTNSRTHLPNANPGILVANEDQTGFAVMTGGRVEATSPRPYTDDEDSRLRKVLSMLSS